MSDPTHGQIREAIVQAFRDAGVPKDDVVDADYELVADAVLALLHGRGDESP